MIRCCHNYVAIRPTPESVTRGGIVLPDARNPGKNGIGEVIAVGPGKHASNLMGFAHGQEPILRPCCCKPGDKVAYIYYGANEIRIDGQDLIVLLDDQIMGILQ
jgi:chaperonin GroES